jgi:hypothetical protein
LRQTQVTQFIWTKYSPLVAARSFSTFAVLQNIVGLAHDLVIHALSIRRHRDILETLQIIFGSVFIILYLDRHVVNIILKTVVHALGIKLIHPIRYNQRIVQQVDFLVGQFIQRLAHRILVQICSKVRSHQYAYLFNLIMEYFDLLGEVLELFLVYSFLKL